MITADYQKLEPGNTVRLFDVDGTEFGIPDVLRFHAYNISITEDEIQSSNGEVAAKSIWWQGNEYSAWPVQIEGLESSTTGASATPKLSVANLDSSITALCLHYDDMLKSKVIIHDTLSHYLDAKNFVDGNPSADPTQERVSVFYIDSKSAETNEIVEFILASPMDLHGVMIPTRQLHSMCVWCIRGQYKSGDGCDYAGQNGHFDKHGNPVDDPSLDKCSGLLKTGCEPRFGKNNPLPFGGFVGTSLLRK